MVFRSLFKQPQVPEVSAGEARARQEAGAAIVDVREPDEWREGHIPGAVHIPLGSLASRLGELDPNQEIVTVCRSGSRSAQAAELLQQAGYRRASSLAGGMLAWSRQSLPVAR